jgi:hypothetical protein
VPERELGADWEGARRDALVLAWIDEDPPGAEGWKGRVAADRRVAAADEEAEATGAASSMGSASAPLAAGSFSARHSSTNAVIRAKASERALAMETISS